MSVCSSSSLRSSTDEFKGNSASVKSLIKLLFMYMNIQKLQKHSQFMQYQLE
jgi:hypothetical protein